MEMIKGILLLLFVLALFSLFSTKAPKGAKAMSGLANAAVASFLVEAIHAYITGDFLGIEFLKEVGNSAGSLGGVAAAILVPISMGANPIFAVVAGVSLSGYGILPGFVAGYAVGFIAPYIEKKLPTGLDIIGGAIIIAPLARGIALLVDPVVNATLINIGDTISIASLQSPLMMGFLLGGIIKMICTSPLSSMALTAMLGLQGLAMGIAAIACVGGSFTNAMVFHRLKLGDRSNVIAVMLEPLTQAPLVTKNPLPIYCSNFFGGGFAGMAAAYFGIINNSPGTASPIPGLLVPFAFNEPSKVLMALALAAVGGLVAGYIGTEVFKRLKYKPVRLDDIQNN
ncbi:MAG: PTS sugar transporter subunit IIC [Clostridium sp.]|uniref:PTS sugar transporter subunit IIC n=1 Tax=Clostridium sp. TaxID=1506 RepID=UPI002FC6CEC6